MSVVLSLPRLLLAFAILGLAGSGAAFALGNTPPAAQLCSAGQMWDPAKAACVKQAAGVLSDDALAAYAQALADSGRAPEAIDVLNLSANKTDPKFLNAMGYAKRKAGRADESLSYYLASVKADPNYTPVREYLGEAYIVLGRIDDAKAQLAEIEKRCGTTCSEYGLLVEALNKARTSQGI